MTLADQVIEMTPVEASGPDQTWIRRFARNRRVRAGARLLLFLCIMQLLHGVGWRGSFLVLNGLRHRGVRLGPSSPYPTLVVDGFLFIALAITCWIMARIERKRAGEYGLPLRMSAIRPATEGIGWGLGAMTAIMLVLWALHAVSFTSPMLGGAAAVQSGAIWLAALSATALFEEYQFRGYPLVTLTEAIGFWPAAIVLSGFFAAVHIENPGENKLGIASVFVFGMAFAWLVRITGSLWFSVGFHLSWDWAESFLFGVPDSGIVSNGRLLAPIFHGPAWLTGGSVGPEASVLCPLALLLTVLVVRKLYQHNATTQLG